MHVRENTWGRERRGSNRGLETCTKAHPDRRHVEVPQVSEESFYAGDGQADATEALPAVELVPDQVIDAVGWREGLEYRFLSYEIIFEAVQITNR